jgi:DNA replication protein DnaC
LVDKMKNADVLFLDDLGAEDTSTWFYNEHLLIILNHRMQNNKITFFNSNLSMESLEKKLLILTKKSANVNRLLDRIKALTKNQQFELKGINKRY